MELNTKEDLISIIKKQDELINQQASRLDVLEKHLDNKDAEIDDEKEEKKETEEETEEVTEKEVDEVSKLLGV